ncbi:DUF2238 domain-containing protein [Microbulbifer thermotolerans]|uniref:DUF2238 domain-containing protein n=1 Tax=Microbulbifer thermotolerans TaxID=252514 RepID=A0A143HNH1_MICTH|nr:DUF2238 domain-containing protein [Microbulbifer thermotolerans]AMX03248.1 hypothetical protein A3224_12265 [Microbulbifer thermotolerans]MCX2780892.1 DUF2238 domain-containing protein [Microbulbifer thermotolerans]MCX2784254.1 DUF2238 domain-containing protein [Microbulbifer thermotolerans]MCX2794331.1 DUF2238 domain-containing protein [Microbulbifer thermotolerans]MCX2800979.1 DUF2238 domain-containing protein [Microbulbifer thermotolerans]
MTKPRYNGYHLFLLGLFALTWCWAAWEPLHPDDWLLENYLVFIFVPIILISARAFRLSKVSYTLITLFMCLHVIGSHYTYAEVPFGETLRAWSGAERNMYDRLVHFCFGLLLAYPVREVLIRLAGLRGFWAYFFPVDVTFALSSIYEIIEWLAADTVSPELGLAFLGSQGDIWDAQKDMLLAGMGAIIAMLIVLALNLWLNSRAWSEIRNSLRIPGSDRILGEAVLAQWLRNKRDH